MSPAQFAEVAFRLHEEKRIDDAELVRLLEGCVNLAALENGYADQHGLPFPQRAPRRPRRAP
ncbi:MAG TPA: hypothetical protein VLE97_06315 [Gaiellaceae bacterium]|nr:hypothetical protein [Gaiellaceae bacterium]